MEFSQRQWEAWRGRRSLLEQLIKAKGFECKGWVNGKPIVPGVFEKDLTEWALSIKEERAKFAAPPTPIIEEEPEAIIESEEPEPEEKPVKRKPGRPRRKRS